MASVINMLSGAAADWRDGLRNLVANLGTSRDKAEASVYVDTFLDDRALATLYRSSWMARKIVDIPALDAGRRWRSWQAEPDQITLIEAEERRLGLQGKLIDAMISARLFGGAAILIGTRETNTARPLRPETIRRGGVVYLTVVNRRYLQPLEIETDPASPWFDQPRAWRLVPGAELTGRGVEIHPSRLVMLRGAGIPDRGLSLHNVGWGDSVLVSAYHAIRALDATAANVASLVFEAKVDTVGIPNLSMIATDREAEQHILNRMKIAETAKGINGTLIHDKDEVIGQKQVAFGGLPDIIDRFMQLAAGAADIPMTRLLGQSPGGLNSTGESDLRNYYDRVMAIQELELRPALQILDECVIRSAIGDRPEEIHYTWQSLWQTDDAQKAAIGKVQAETIKVLNDTRLIPEEALAEAAVNVLTETGVMPGLDQAVARYMGAGADLALAAGEGDPPDDDVDAAGDAGEGET